MHYPTIVIFLLAVFVCSMVHTYNVITKHNKTINQCYMNVGTCLEGGTLWDKENKVAYFCSATKVVGL